MAGGAYIRFKDGNIEIHAPGVIDQKAGSFPHAGPTSLSTKYPNMAKLDGAYERKIIVTDELGAPIGNRKVKVIFGDGRLEEGLTDPDGLLNLYANDVMESIRIEPYEGQE